MKKNKSVGASIPIAESYDKVTGKTVYGGDFVLPGMLYAKILHSPMAHARIKRIDSTAAARMPGVIAVVTGQDAPDTTFGIKITDERFLARDEVFYVGDEVAAVVAVDEESAKNALPFIKVDYEPLEPVMDIREAVKPGSPLARMDKNSNICHHTEAQFGDVDAAFKNSDVVIEETFYLPHQYHAYIEPHAAVAEWKKGRLTIYCPHQAPRQLEKCVCEGLNLPKNGFQFIQTAMGGGFGGKTHSRVAPLAAFLARVVGRPVRLSLTREEDIQCSMPSVPMLITVKLGAKQDGTLTAKEVHFLADNGAYSYSAVGVVEVAAERVDTMYRVNNVRVSGDLIYTNKMGTSAFRGYGNSQMHFAVESAMDILAKKLGMDAVELRLKNATRKGDVTVYGRRIDSCGLSESIQKAAELIRWNEPRPQTDNKFRGVGLACAIHVSGSTTVSPQGAVAIARLFEDGTVHIANSEGDIGQGANTVMAQIASQVLEIPFERIVVDTLDTDVTNFGVGAIGSRVTVLGGNAVRAGAVAIRERIIETAAKKWNCSRSEVNYSEGVVYQAVKEEAMSLAEVATFYYDLTGGSRIIGEALYTPQGVVPPDKNKVGNVSLGYSFCTHAAEVEIDRESGAVTVVDYVAVHDSGKIINPLTFAGQVQGAALMGIGWALGEELLFENGRVINPDFTNYRVPTAMDALKVRVVTLDIDDPNGPFGAKSIGEVAFDPIAPTILNAICNASGFRFKTLPVNPERFYLAMKYQGRENENPTYTDYGPVGMLSCDR